MAYSLQQILGFQPITKAIQQTTTGVPNPFPAELMTTTENIVGNKGTYVQWTGERRTSRLVKYGSPAKNADLRPVSDRTLKLMHTFESVAMDPLIFKYLRSANKWEWDKPLEEVKRQVKEHKQKFENLRVSAIAHAFRRGRLDFDADGNLLPNASGAIETVDFGFNANNQNQLNGIISASWALANTNIPLHLRNLKKRARRLTGYPLKIALYGENIPGYFTQNDYVLDYLARNDKMNAAYLDSAHGEIPNGLFGFTWIPVYEAFFEDSAGTNQDLWDADAVTFLPSVSDDWYSMMQGSFEVPTTINILNDAEAAMRSTETVYGQFGYGCVTHNPVTVNGYFGDTFLPLIKNPDAVFQADVTP